MRRFPSSLQATSRRRTHELEAFRSRVVCGCRRPGRFLRRPGPGAHLARTRTRNSTGIGRNLGCDHQVARRIGRARHAQSRSHLQRPVDRQPVSLGIRRAEVRGSRHGWLRPREEEVRQCLGRFDEPLGDDSGGRLRQGVEDSDHERRGKGPRRKSGYVQVGYRS